MSYDLYFRKKNGQDLSLNEFSEYFSRRPRYKFEKTQAFYENEDTGCYFIMEHNDIKQPPPEKTETPADISPANLNLNFVRPHIFGLECEPEVHAFVKHFDFLIFDPQNDGNSTDTYDTQAFIRGYNVGNKFSYGTILKQNAEIANATYPAVDIERNWLWNLHKAALQAKLGENIFLPTISYQMLNGQVKSLIVWSEAIPTAFPDVDTVIVFRTSLAPSGFFSGKKNDYTIKEFSEILPLLSDKTADGFRELTSPEKAREWVKSLPASDVKPTPIHVDRVLDRELMPSA